MKMRVFNLLDSHWAQQAKKTLRQHWIRRSIDWEYEVSAELDNNA